MDELKKVIKGLELCDIGSGDKCYETGCPYYQEGCTERLKEDALELLKAKEPREMTLEEIKAWACKNGSEKDAVYIQNFNDPEFVWAYLGKFESDSGISQFDGYGYSWRCWTARPTDEQREAVKWDG